MAKQLNVNLAFTADTSKARSQLQDLQNQLSKLTSAPAQQLNLKWTEKIQEATIAAMELKTHLQNAMNVQTGNLDFTKLNNSIKQSGKTLSDYGRQLQSLGPAGQQAFISLANAVVQSEIPIRRSNAALKEMMTTLKNTARWQLSSSMLHGFMGAVQGAYRYAQDLDASLNNIRIVTGQNVEQMTKFAESANKAAKALSTTTTDYTNASLIYYQQGLSDAEVAKRTAVTVKMANVAGQSAQTVSDQLTSVWNNFYDGSKSLEYYADVMTALGAATASSTDEIAGGLEKFAAVADTIGLSYEYAASALATITSNTRQSEEVVGTALKTIFARIQGLNLGETLEDGTTLNKYSEALQKVGISIFESNGEIKKMDSILDEMAMKWQTLAKDQQIALAQTVAGVRQYNQLVSLMDNWNSGDNDSMAANLKTAYGATGSLQKQADIYAESWEAAQDRARAAAEGVFDSLVDEDFFIGLLNGLEDVLTFIEKTIDAVGGLKGVLSAVSVVMTKMFSDQMAQGLRNMAHNIYMSTEGGRKQIADEKLKQMRQMRSDLSLGDDGTGDEVGKVANEQFEQQLKLQEQLMLNSENMSEAEIANAQQLLDLRKQIGEEVVKAKQAEIDAKNRFGEVQQAAYVDMGREALAVGDSAISDETLKDFQSQQETLKKIHVAAAEAKMMVEEFGSSTTKAMDPNSVMRLVNAFDDLPTILNMTEQEVDEMFIAISAGGEEAEIELQKLLQTLYTKSGKAQANMSKEFGIGKNVVADMAKSYEEMARGAKRSADATDKAARAQELASKQIAAAKGVVKDWANSITSGAQAVMSFVSIINSAKGAIDALTNPDMSGWEKFFSVLQSGAMIVTMTVSMFNSLMQAKKNWEAGTLKNAAATMIEAAATTLSTKANEQNAKAQHKKAAGHKADSRAAGEDAAKTALEGTVTDTSGKKQIKVNKSLSSSFKQLGSSLKSYIKAYAGYAAGLALIVGSIALIAGTITVAINQSKAAQQRAEDAAKAAEQLSNNYKDLKTNYEAFSSTVDNYKNAIESIKSLDKSTAEYNETLLKANEYAMDLIDTYDLLGQYTIEGGLITFNDGALENAQKAALAKMSKAQAAMYMGSAAESYYTGQSNQTSTKRDINSASDVGWHAANTAVTGGIGTVAGAGLATGGGMIAGMISGAGAGAVFGSSVPLWGTIIGAAIGLIVGGVTSVIHGVQTKAEDEAIDTVIEYTKKHGDGIFAAQSWEDFGEMLTEAELAIDDTDLIKSLYANRDAVRQLANAEVARAKKESAQWEAGFRAYNTNNEAYTNLEVGQGYLDKKASAYREENIEGVREEVDALWSGSNDDFWAEYLKHVYGQETVDVDNTTGENVRITELYGDTVTVQKKNAEGVWETFGEAEGLNEDVAAEQLVNAILLERASAAMDFEQLNTLVAELNKANLTTEKDAKIMDSILTSYGENGTVSLANFSVSDIMSINASQINNSELRNALETAIQSYKDNMTQVQNDVINSDWYKNLTPEEQDLVWTLNIKGYDSEADIEQLINAVQSALDAATFSLKIDSIQNLEKLIKDTNKDWNSIFTEYAKLFNQDTNNDGKIDGNDLSFDQKKKLTTASDEELLELLTAQQDTIIEKWSNSIPDSIEKQEEALANARIQANENATAISDYTNLSAAEQIDYVYNKGKISDADYAAWQYYNEDGNLYNDEAIYTLFDELRNNDGTFRGKKLTTDQLKFINGFLKGYDAENKWGSPENLGAISNLTYDDSETTDEFYRYLGLDPDKATPSALSQRLIGFDDGFSLEQAFVGAIMDTMFDSGSNLTASTIASNYVKTLPTAESAGVADREAAVIEAYKNRKAWYDQFEEQNTAFGLNNQDVTNYAETLKDLAEAGEDVSDSLVKNEYTLHKVSQQIQRSQKGLTNLTSSFESLYKTLQSDIKTSASYIKALRELDTIMSDILTIDIDTLSSDFLTSESNLLLMKEAIEGNLEALDELRVLAAQDIIVHAKLSETDTANLLTKIDTLSQQEIQIGASLDGNKFASGLLAAAEAAGMTTSQIQAMFDSLGWEPTLTFKEVDLTDAQTMYGNSTVDVIDPLTGEITTVNGKMLSQYATNGKVTIPSINGEATVYRGDSGITLDPGNTNKSGGSKPKKTTKTHQTKVVDRYKEINDAIEKSKKAMDDASRAADGLWGKARLKEMEKVRSEMGKQLNLLKQRKAAAMTDLTEDQNWLNNTIAQEYGITFTFDPNDGTISNYYEIMDQLHQDLRNAEIRAGATLDKESEQEEIDAINEKISALQGAIDIYEATRKEINDTDTAIKEMIRSIQEANLEELNLQLEMEIMIDDAQLEKIEYYLNKITEDIWSMAEAAALMTGQSKDLFNIDLGQAEVWTSKFADFQKQYNDLVYAYTHIDPKTGKTFINQEQFVKALEELQGQIYDNLGNINELDKTMIGYYGETLAAAAEELSKFTDLMGHHVEVLDHYGSLLEIMGKSKDWTRMKTILQTQVDVAENAAEVSKANYKMLEAELLEKQAAYDALDPNDDSHEAQVIRQQWLDAKNAANEAQLQMLEDAEAWAEALKALLETELEELGDNLEKALAGDFGSLDYMMTSMERANSLQEEYLTTTNKIYETNKLMRTAQQEIDKTSNTVAKRRMAQFIEETQQMQNQNKVSQYELDIQQAKYNLLLAEIALEEAQNAKSTVRLRRDSEGNFGYVYTADQNAVSEAQQQLEDAQNALYNIGLEGANKYTEQYAQTIQEMNDAVRELTNQWQNGEIASKEEYQAKMLALEEYYGEKLKQFSHLHSIAIQTDSRITSEAWSSDFSYMTTQTEDWMKYVSDYVNQVNDAFGRYDEKISDVEKYAGADLDSLKTKTENIKEENEKLVTSITDSENGLLVAMQKEIDKVNEITQKYAAWRDTIQGVIDKQEELAKQINKDIKQETDDDETNDYKPETETPETTSPEDESNKNSGDDGIPSYKKGVLSWTGNGSARIWTDSEGKTYSATSAEGRAIQAAFARAHDANGGYKGDYFLGWNKLNADILHEKYGLSTGGYTGDWSGSFGKLAFLHQKELVLNKQDTENMLNAMDLLDHILQMIDLQSASAQLGGILSTPHFSNLNASALEQQVHIEASFPGVQDRNEIEEAFNNLINRASQYANRK